MMEHYDPTLARLDALKSLIDDVRIEQSKTSELLEKILKVLENPPAQKIIHVNLSYDVVGYTLDALKNKLREF